MSKILVFTNHYLPGFKGGGPIRTIANMINALGDEFKFYIVTLNRDLGEEKQYVNIVSDTWQDIGASKVYYASESILLLKIWRIIRDFDGGVLHLNSFFSFQFSIVPLLITLISRPDLDIILGPRGEFSLGALQLKPIKKKLYIWISKIFRIYRHVTWQASTEIELLDIRHVFGAEAKIVIATDIASHFEPIQIGVREGDSPLKMIFISRICPIKNLIGCIKILKYVKCPVILNVYGPIEDLNYWHSCQIAAEQLPGHIKFSYGGELCPDQVANLFVQHDLFIFPTLGENFGHVIAEALCCGLPVLINNTTPWRGLADKDLGWDIELESVDLWVACIEACYSKPIMEYSLWRQQIRAWALENIGTEGDVDQSRQLFMNLRK
jgi:glycosyltransferase involved in cell wall biosynthesis